MKSQTYERQEFEKLAQKLGLKPEYFKRRILMKAGFGATIIGIQFNTKYAIIVEAADKNEYGVTAKWVRSQLS